MGRLSCYFRRSRIGTFLNTPFRRFVGLILCILVILWPYTISIGQSGGNFTLVNRTNYFIHANVNGKWYLYITPGGSIRPDGETYYNVVVQVVYAPGQEVFGSATKTLEATVTTSSTASSDCSSSSHSNNDCHTNETSSGSTSVSSIVWNVVPSDFTQTNAEWGTP